MKYGILFLVLGALLFYLAVSRGGWNLLILWPALSLMVVAAGYLGLGTRVYGKSSEGVLSPATRVLLLPYLVYMGAVWHVGRLLKSESAVNHLADNLYIGRRLLSHERPADITHVIDLTSEFTETRSLRQDNYHLFPILDGHVASAAAFRQWIEQAASLSGNVYIHCAEGHGRTAMFAAALLLRRGIVSSVEEALQSVLTSRPKARPARSQLAALQAFAQTLGPQSSNA